MLGMFVSREDLHTWAWGFFVAKIAELWGFCVAKDCRLPEGWWHGVCYYTLCACRWTRASQRLFRSFRQTICAAQHAGWCLANGKR